MLACSFTQSCLTLCNPVDSGPPGSSVHGISQGRILEWDAISSPSGSSRPRDQTCISCSSCTDRQILYHWAIWEATAENKKKRVSKHFPQVPEHIIAKMLKIKHKEKNLEGSQSKKKHTYKGKTSAKFSSETMQNSNVTSSESQKTKTWQLRFSTQWKYLLKIMVK